ncbi:MAG: YihY/virulence factor BrkB family protein [Rhodanobacter sp.]
MTTPTSRAANEARGKVAMPGKQPGAEADRPMEIPLRGWWDIAKRAFASLGTDHVSLVAGGVAFFAFLAIFPALSALIAIYGLIITPDKVAAQVGQLAGILPAQAQDMLNDVLLNITTTSESTLGWGLLFSVILSLWSANKGTTALFTCLNIVYNEVEKRSFIRLKLTTLAFTLAGFLAAILCLVLIVGISAVVDKLGLAPWLESLVSLVRWPVLALVFLAALALAYRYAPSRNSPKFRWVSVGSITSTVLWLVLSAGFAWYVGNFGNYDEVYGSLAAVVVTLMWLFLTVAMVLVGAEINGEMEAQTNKDTTVNPDEPIGSRGAYYADHKPYARNAD